MPTELRPDLNVGLRFFDSYAVPFLRRKFLGEKNSGEKKVPYFAFESSGSDTSSP